MKGKGKIVHLFDFLRQHEASAEAFTLEELAQVTGYSLSTIQTYNRKKFRNFLVFRQNDGKYIARGVGKLTAEQFFTHMEQRSQEVTISVEERFSRRLSERAVDAFILALENYNRPSLRNRVEAFTIFIVNAWELLLKSKLVASTSYEALFYQGTERSLSLRDILKKTYQDNDPVRCNIEFIEELRDDAVHLLIPELQPCLSKLFQASVLNFVKKYQDVTGVHPLSGQGEGLLSLVVDGESPNLEQIRIDYGSETAERVKRFLNNFALVEKEHSSHSFSIPMEYKLVLTKKGSESDLMLSYGQDGQPTLMVEVPKDINHLYPYREKEAIQELNYRLPKEIHLRQYSFRAIVLKHKVKQNDSFHYEVNLSKAHLYSEQFILWVIDKISKNDKWVQEAVQFYRHYLAKNRSKK